MKKFIIKIFFVFSPILIIILVINFFGDAANIFRKGYESKIADLLNEGKNVTNISNYDERILQKEIIGVIENIPDIVILGSSRTMLINDKYFEGNTMINNSVSGASFEDYIAIFQLYKVKGIIPNKIIIGIDPWLFNKNNGQNRWKSLNKEYSDYFAKGKNKNLVKEFGVNFEKIEQLFSLSYFQASFSNMSNYINGNIVPIPTNKMYNNENTKLPDGSLIYGRNYREATDAQIDSKVDSYLEDKIYALEYFNEISPEIIRDFTFFINDIKDKEIIVEFILIPYHPKVYSFLSNKPDYINALDTENFILKFAQDNDIRTRGSFNPSNLNFDKTFFFDGMHCKGEAIKKIISP